MLSAPQTGFLPELLSFVSTCIFSGGSQLGYLKNLFSRVIDGRLEEVFIPFLPSNREDFVYHMMFQNKEDFRRWRCGFCETIFCVVDCGMLTHEGETDREGKRRGASVRSVCIGCEAELSQ